MKNEGLSGGSYKWWLLAFLFVTFSLSRPIAEVTEAQAILERGENRGKVVLHLR